MMDTILKYREITQSLIKGNVVCFPTETLYALAVDAYNQNSIEKLYQIKKRDPKKPFALMVPNLELAKSLAFITEGQLFFMEKYLPGSVTFILPRNKNCKLPMILGNNIGIRIPKHKIALDILKKIDGPLATTSANLSSGKNPQNFLDIPQKIIDQLGHYIVDNKVISGIGSTVIDITTEPFRVLRQGKIKT